MTLPVYSPNQVLALMQSLSPEDLHILQNDTLGRDPDMKSLIPTHLTEAFVEWLREYGPVESETMMALENQRETEARFLEEFEQND